MEWTKELVDQLDWWWTNQVRPRFTGLTDDEYYWEPVPDSWSIRDGAIDWAWPAPEPAPVTTIAWRLGHVIVSVLGVRAATHFGGPQMSPVDFAWAATADEALQQLDEAYDRWIGGVRSLDEAGLARACGEAGWEEYTMAALVLHINRECLAHGAEISLLRDLYLRRA